MYDIRKLRYKQIKWGIRFHKYSILDNLASSTLMSHIGLLIFGLPYVLQNGFELNACLRKSPLKWNMFQPSQMFIDRKILHKLQQNQI